MIPTPGRTSLREAAEAALRALAGDRAQLRDDQWAAIEALVTERRRVLVVQRTGWGKSAVYFVATILLRAQGAGPTVIVSPLLALMRNQIAAAERAGIRAVTINSTNSVEWAGVHEQIRAGQVDVLLVSPERLNNPGFRDAVLPRLAAEAGLLVIDEAHCISDWGHDFRPDYRRIRTLLASLPGGIPVLATTATANRRVTADVAEQLDPHGNADVLVLRGSLDRESLHLAVLRLSDQPQQLGWLAEHLSDFPGSGIVYTLTVAATQEVAGYLRSQGITVAAYSGQTEQTERLQAEDDLINNRVKALVATSALGMGFDKPDLGFVIHLGAPPSPIAYYQQVGRAGRGVDRATVVLLPGRDDREVWDYFASLAFPGEQLVRKTLRALQEHGGAMSTAALETRVELRRNRLETMLKVLDVDGAVRRVGGGWTSTGQPWLYDSDRYARVAQARRAEQVAMLDYTVTPGCRMQFLRVALDDPEAAPCGRCDNCGGVTVNPEVGEQTLAAATDRLARPGVAIDPRRQWPSAMADLGVPLKGKIPPGELPEPGRAIARLTDLGWGGQLRDLLRPGSADGPLPVPLRRALVAVLESWEFEPRPDGIAVIGSLSRPRLVDHLADGLSRYTGLPVRARLVPAAGRPPQSGQVNSAQRLRAVHDRFTVAASGTLQGSTLLLLDDVTESGWTLTIAARQLRQAGVTAVHPLVLALRA
ncbi:MAG: DEAD/DEAH box helicase [Candidatus Dormibacteria bacterium]